MLADVNLRKDHLRLIEGAMKRRDAKERDARATIAIPKADAKRKRKALRRARVLTPRSPMWAE